MLLGLNEKEVQIIRRDGREFKLNSKRLMCSEYKLSEKEKDHSVQSY